MFRIFSRNFSLVKIKHLQQQRMYYIYIYIPVDIFTRLEYFQTFQIFISTFEICILFKLNSLRPRYIFHHKYVYETNSLICPIECTTYSLGISSLLLKHCNTLTSSSTISYSFRRNLKQSICSLRRNKNIFPVAYDRIDVHVKILKIVNKFIQYTKLEKLRIDKW